MVEKSEVGEFVADDIFGYAHFPKVILLNFIKPIGSPFPKLINYS